MGPFWLPVYIIISVLTALISIFLLFPPFLLFTDSSLLHFLSIGDMPDHTSASSPSSTGACGMSPSPPNTSMFSVHVFVNHDPLLAPVFLPSLFSNLPDSVWRLPKLAKAPRRPPLLPGEPEPSHSFIEPRMDLGRYVFAEPLPGSTTLHEISESIEKQFDIERKLHAHFTIFPLYHNFSVTHPLDLAAIKNAGKCDEYDAEGYPYWHDRPLPQHITIGEVEPLDVDSAWVNEPSDVPVVHLVLETKAAALSRIVGKNLRQVVPGRDYEQAKDLKKWPENIRYLLDRGSQPDLVSALKKWRHARYALAYLENERNKRPAQEQGGEQVVPEASQKIEDVQRDKDEANILISTRAGQWTNWVLDQEFVKSTNADELPDKEVEATVQRIWQTKNKLIDEWKASESKHTLMNESQKEHVNKPAARSKDNPDTHKKHKMDFSEIQRQDGTDKKLKASDEKASESEPTTSSSQDSRVDTFSFRQADGTISKDMSTFTLGSGILLWAQILPIYYGTFHTDFTNNAARIPNMLPGGTIRQHVYTYKSAARNGAWKVRRYYSNWGAADMMGAQPTSHAGWVVCHEDFDPLEIIRRVRAINPRGNAISNGNVHINKDVFYVNRYDWSYHWHSPTDPDFETKFQTYAEPAVGPVTGNEWLGQKSNIKTGGYFMALDVEGWDLDLLRAYKQECEGEPGFDHKVIIERVFKKVGRKFGAFVSMPFSEYEFGWLVFSGKRHAENDADELIGIVYDGKYEVLEGLDHAVEADPERPQDVGVEH